MSNKFLARCSSLLDILVQTLLPCILSKQVLQVGGGGGGGSGGGGGGGVAWPCITSRLCCSLCS